ncbi:MAG TPA: FAD-dependent oxidoreductase [Pseudonocardiaceae bacterium]|nr:FAD-dependent oxidoreductase [Pseudonocardiaceae bacterium]
MRSITVVGASLAGLSAARALREQSFDGRIVLVGAEQHRPYDRPPLSKEFLAGTMSADDLDLATPDDDALGFDWRLGRRAVALEPSGAAVVLDTGERIVSDGVVIATGAVARTLPGPRVHTLRTLDDAIALRAELTPGARLVLVGAGFIGAEIASTAASLGVEVTLVEALPTPLAGPLGVEMGRVCATLHGEHGVRLIVGVGVDAVLGDRRVRLTDGRELAADVVVAGIGAVPAVDWLADSGLRLDNGVLTDADCATNLPGVVAVGDCAHSYRPHLAGIHRFEHWTNALQQPAIAAATLLGRSYQPPASHTVPYFWSDQYGLKLQFAGHRRDGDQVEVVERDTDSRSFLAVYRRDGRPVAVFAINRPRPFARWRRELATHDVSYERCQS